MDSDTLIKLAKAGLKEVVCEHFAVRIPRAVVRETIEDAGARPEAEAIRDNLRLQRLAVAGQGMASQKGEEAVLSLYRAEMFDAIASDDKRFLKKLRVLGIPYVTSSVFIPLLMRKMALNESTALIRLEALAPHISPDDYHIVKIHIQDWSRR